MKKVMDEINYHKIRVMFIKHYAELLCMKEKERYEQNYSSMLYRTYRDSIYDLLPKDLQDAINGIYTFSYDNIPGMPPPPTESVMKCVLINLIQEL